MVTRVNGGIFDNQALTGSLCHYRILGANFSGAISDGTYTIINGAGPNIDLVLADGEPIPFSAAEIVMQLVLELATVVITNPTAIGMYFATENTDNGWLDISALEQCIRDLGNNVGIDGLDLTGVTVECVPYILGEDTTLAGLEITNINGHDMVTLVDADRMKTLTVTEQEITFADDKAGDLDWINVGTSNHADTGYVTDYDGTVTSVTGHCSRANGNLKDFHLYKNGTDQGSIGSLFTNDGQFLSTIIDIDFDQADKLQIRSEGAGGPLRDVVIKITMKWRG